jgi:hypothetical protein
MKTTLSKSIKFACLLFLQITFINTITIAQQLRLPLNYKLEQKEDYAKYEKVIVDCVNWMESTPLDEQAPSRKDAYAFLFKWVEGSPTVTISLTAGLTKFTDKNTDLLFIFIGAWTKYVIENPAQKENYEAGNLVGLKSALKYYEKNRENGIVKDKTIEKLLKMTDAELAVWVKKNLMA